MKFAVFTIKDAALCKTHSGLVERITTNPHLRIKDYAGAIKFDADINLTSADVDPYELAIYKILELLKEYNVTVVAAGHRVVHGALKYQHPVIVTPEIVDYLSTLEPLAPLHQPFNLRGIEVFTKKFPTLKQIACFDTSFHFTCNDLTRLFAIPKKYRDAGLIRYGFHGLSYEYIVSQFDKYLPKEKTNGKVIIAHLGQGASMCAVHNKKSLANTFGFSVLDGLPMGTRCGNFDPGAILYLMKNYGLGYEELSQLLYKESGLLGVSGVSSDMRELFASDSKDAKLAIDLFVYRSCSWIASLAAELQGIDGIIFTAGIGENSPQIREKICMRLEWLGAKIDVEKNAKNAATIHRPESKLFLHVIPTDEELMIAEQTLRMI
ncbi:MAG: acetate/propionate family kinase [Endomicrobiales bacterium]|nr:acetate/propionate family kinase [Endomicrobiales bacterium]